MIEKIYGLPENVLGFQARGQVSAEDYETVVIPAVEAMFANQDMVRFLYHLGEDFTGFEPSAMWEDAKLGLKHLSGWQRLAVVTDTQWIRWAVKIFGLAIPGQIRIFHNADLAKAKKWISE